MNLTRASISKLYARERRYVVFDDKLKGFGVRVSPTGGKSFIFEYRPSGAGRSAVKRRITIGRAENISTDDARLRAKKLLAEVVHGRDPAIERAAEKKMVRLIDVADLFMREHAEAKRKPRTASHYQQILDKHILPKFGAQKLKDISRAEVAKLHLAISRSSPFAANKALAVLSSLWGWAARRDLCAINSNPVVGVERNREIKRQRFLNSPEIAALGRTLALAETEGLPWAIDERKPTAKHAPRPENRRTIVDPRVTSAIRLLLLTGCRLREILNLRWAEVNFDHGLVLLQDSKTGSRAVVLSGAAVGLLHSQPREAGSDFVFPGPNGTPRTDIKKPWAAIIKHAGLEGLRIHDLRHSAASLAANAGFSLPIIGRLLGHTQAATTQRYAHIGFDPARDAANAIGRIVEKTMNYAQRTTE